MSKVLFQLRLSCQARTAARPARWALWAPLMLSLIYAPPSPHPTPPPCPPSSCHTQLFRSSISPCPPLLCFISALSVSLSLHLCVHLFVCLLVAPRSDLSLCRFLYSVSPSFSFSSRQFPSVYHWEENLWPLCKTLDFNLCTQRVTAKCSVSPVRLVLGALKHIFRQTACLLIKPQCIPRMISSWRSSGTIHSMSRSPVLPDTFEADVTRARIWGGVIHSMTVSCQAPILSPWAVNLAWCHTCRSVTWRKSDWLFFVSNWTTVPVRPAEELTTPVTSTWSIRG